MIGILNLEWAVRPLGRIDAATPELAVANAMSPFDLTNARIVQYKNVFPVPPGLSIKNAPPTSENAL